MAHVHINTYQQVLLQHLLNKELGVPLNPTIQDLKSILDPRVGTPRTIAKLYHRNSSNDKFQDVVLNGIIRQMELKKENREVKTWKSFIREFAPSSDILNSETDLIPIAHFKDLSDLFQQKIAKAVKTCLEDYYDTEQEEEELYFSSATLLPKVEVNTKINLFLNTAWYMYFLHEKAGEPRIGRLVLKIGSSSGEVSITNFKKPVDNDYTGKIELDSSQVVLIFSMSTPKTNEKCLHMKAYLNTNDVPEIALGHYSNLGDGGIGLISGTIILEHIGSVVDAQNLTSQEILPGDPEFDTLHEGIIKYLRDKSLNFHKIKTQIFTKERLLAFVNEYTEKKRGRKKIKTLKDVRVEISAPKYSIGKETFEKVFSAITDLASFLREEYDFLVHHADERYDSSLRTPWKYHEYQQRIEDCDIFILFYFDKAGSTCLSELTWAIDEGKEVLILTSDRSLLPKLFQDLPLTIHWLDNQSSPNKAVENIKSNKNYFFQKFLTSTKPNKK